MLYGNKGIPLMYSFYNLQLVYQVCNQRQYEADICVHTQLLHLPIPEP